MQTYSPLAQHSRRLLLTLFGGISGFMLTVVCAFLLFSGLFINLVSNAVAELVKTLPKSWQTYISGEMTIIGLLFCLLFWGLVKLKQWAKQAIDRDQLEVDTTVTGKVDVMVQFLSVLWKSEHTEFIQLLATPNHESLKTLQLESLKDCPWRMNLTAIVHQLELLPVGRCLDLVVIPSQQSIQHWDLFTQVISQCFGGRVRLYLCSKYLSEPTCTDNTDYEDLQTVFLLLQKIQQRCAENPRRIVCFDATSGTKICSVAAAMVSLSQSQGVQYVSNDYKVQSYQLQYSQAEQ